MPKFAPPQGFGGEVPQATSTTLGTVEVSAAPATGENPVALSTTDTTVPRLDAAQTWTATQTFNDPIVIAPATSANEAAQYSQLGGFGGQYLTGSQNVSLTASDYGTQIQIGTSGITITLPANNGISGQAIWFYPAFSSGSITINVTGSGQFIYAPTCGYGSSSTTAIPVNAGEWLCIMARDSGEFDVVAGSWLTNHQTTAPVEMSGSLTTGGTVTAAAAGGLVNGSNGIVAGNIPNGNIATVITNAEAGYSNHLEQLMIDGTIYWHVDAQGNAVAASTVTTSQGELGSAAGTWTPASGTFNVAAGTVINVAAVPSAATMYFVAAVSGFTGDTAVWGATTSAGSVWNYSQAVSGSAESFAGSASGISSTTTTGGIPGFWCDGSYYTYGYLQINGGYLQFVATSAGTASSDAQNTIRWGVS